MCIRIHTIDASLNLPYNNRITKGGFRLPNFFSRIQQSVSVRGLAHAVRRQLCTRLLYGLRMRFAPNPAKQSSTRPLQVIVPVYNTDPAMLRAMVSSVRRQRHTNWHLLLSDGGSDRPETLAALRQCVQEDERIFLFESTVRLGISDNTNRALSHAKPGYVILCDHDDLLSPFALRSVACAIDESGADLLYSDEDRVTRHFLSRPHYKPGFSPDRLRAQNYVCHLLAFSTGLLAKAGPLRADLDGSQDHDLILRLSEHAEKIVHLPQMLYHWRRVKTSASQQNLLRCLNAGAQAVQDHLDRMQTGARVRIEANQFHCLYPLPAEATVSAIVYTQNSLDSIQLCHNALLSGTQQPTEFLTARNTGKGIYVALQQAAQIATGDYLLFLDATTLPKPNMLAELLSLAAQPGVGSVSPLLINAHGRPVCAGFGIADDRPVMLLSRGDRSQYYSIDGGAGSVTNILAASRWAMLLRRDMFVKIGGFDTAFQQEGGDIDLCVRLHAIGLRHIYTPFASAFAQIPRAESTTPIRYNLEDWRHWQAKWPQGIQDPYIPALLLKRPLRWR